MNTRDHLLQVATDLVSELGSRALTLEAVAKRAGVSKGGLLYHFPSKRALIGAMVAMAVDAFERALVAAESNIGDWLLGYLEATLADLKTADPLSGVLTAVAEEPELLEPFRGALERWYHRAEADYGPEAVPLLLALDALWLHIRLGTLPSLNLGELGQTLRRQASACRRKRGQQ